jgi:hypothetical protein
MVAGQGSDTARLTPLRRAVAATVVAAGLAAGGCAGGSAATPPGGRGAQGANATQRPAAGSGTSPAAGPSRPESARADFTVRGSVPVPPNPSQDTHADDPGAACEPQAFRRDQTLGQVTVVGFTSAGAPVSAMLLTHFLAGTGTAMRFGAGSQISREARASRVFQHLNRNIQAIVASRLRAGTSRVRLPASALPTIRFGQPGATRDLYLAFRGTQGLDVRGSGTRTGHGYTGSLTYVIRDSYGFTPQDQLLGIGAAMRYLQTACGNPPVAGGAHWFPDSITVTVPVNVPGR